MIRYFFDFATNGDVSRDEEGVLLAGEGSARRVASHSLADLARDEILSDRPISHLAVSVRNGEKTVCEAVFRWASESGS
jgi:hypothetical protein